ncbi:MAG: pyridoxal kinase [Pseudomonadota bacterium]
MQPTSVIVISSHVVRGTVGNRAAAFALETLGHPVWAVPTITLSWHPGHHRRAGLPVRTIPAAADFSDLLKALETAPWLPEVGGILSGYLGDASQAAAIASLVRAARLANPSLLYAADPVIGDGDRLYVPEDVAEAVRETLLPEADITTPNPFELSWLTGSAVPQSPHETAALAAKLGSRHSIKSVLATSAPAMMNSHIANLLVEGGQAHMAEHRMMATVPNGLGDLTAALFLSEKLEGQARGEQNLARTTSRVASVLKRHAALQARGTVDELALEAATDELKRPSAPIAARALGRFKP